MVEPLPNEECFLLHGAKVAVNNEIASPIVMEAIRNQWYERTEAEQIQNIVQEGDRVVELGGGIGYISSIAGLTGKAQSLTVIEANPYLIPIIRRNHELNDIQANVRNEVILPSPQSPTIPFYIRKDFWASSLSAEPWGYKEAVDVPTRSFADMLRDERPTMLIVDIEGGEHQLFRDVPLTGIKKVYVEVHQNVIGRIAMKEVFDFFSSRDFHYDQHHSSGSVVLFSHVLR